MISIGNGTTTATADDVTAARLERDLNADVIVGPAGPTISQASFVGPWTGELTFLLPTLAAALALDAVIRQATATITAAGHPLHAFKFRAVNQLRVVSERAQAGIPARWTLTVPFVQVP